MTWQDPENSDVKMVHAARGNAQYPSIVLLLCLLMPTLGSACDRARLEFDPDSIDRNGLMGPAGGKRYLDYEFCVPADPALLHRLQAGSPTLHCRPGAKGRSACRPDQALCIGNTGSPNWRGELCRFSTLPFVQQIRRTWWE